MLGSRFYYKNPFSAWQIPGYDTQYIETICEARSRKKWDGSNRPFDRHVTVSAAVVNL